MKIVFNCCTKPALFKHNAGVTLFKGEKPEVEVKPQVKTDSQPLAQPTADTVEISGKKGPEVKCEGDECKGPDCKK
ncbi:MAG: hypothetical protein WCY19_07140 [Candidatus Gastranaerophilaceae bacterium]